MKIELFPDQEELIERLKAAARRKRKVLLQSATGSGKTVMFSKIIQDAQAKNARSIFNVPRRALMMQTSETFNKYKIPHSFITDDMPFNPFAPTFISTTETLAGNLDKAPKDIRLLIPDETDYGADSLGMIINEFAQRGATVLGGTATPWKANGQGLGVWYDEMVQGKSVRWLIENKRLSEFRYFEGKTKEDFHALQKNSDAQNAEYMESKRVIIGDCVADYKLRCLGKRHIVRCASIKHSQLTAEAFRAAGIRAAHVDGFTRDDEKMRIFVALARRQLDVVTFADLLSFGWDLSAYTGIDVCIESGSDMKICKSLRAQMQWWGRLLRMKPFPAIMNDHVNNHEEHGLPWDDREWTLESICKKSGIKVPSTRQCPECWFVDHIKARCVNCGYHFPVEETQIEAVAGELTEVDIYAQSQQKRKLQAEAKDFDSLVKLYKSQGSKYPAKRAQHVLDARKKKEDEKKRLAEEAEAQYVLQQGP